MTHEHTQPDQTAVSEGQTISYSQHISKTATNHCERCGEEMQSSLPHCAKCHRELWTEPQPEKTAQHSPLPWERYGLTIGNKEHPVIAGAFDSFDAEMGDFADDEALANAQFIVEACNNYERVRTERDEFRKIMDDLHDAATRFEDRAKRAEAERDELLAALKATLRSGSLNSDARSILQAAIAKAER